MPRQFNIAGPCQADIHYMLPPERRLPGVRGLIDGRDYFVLHAPRQVGKTTAMLRLGQDLTAEGRFAAVMLSCETGATYDDLDRAVPAMLGAWRARATAFLPSELRPPPWPKADPSTALRDAIEAWCLACPRPLVLFLDEVDSLAPEVLGALLRQLRDGHPNRPRGFPWALALVGMRDLKDYVVTSGGSGRPGAGSPFNVSAGSLVMRSFTRAEIAELYSQHTSETGQAFESLAVDRVWELTFGQPWLVNALAREATSVVVPDRTRSVTAPDVDTAKETLVRTRPTHLQSLGSRVREPRVHRVVEAVMAGEGVADVPADDLEYVAELGLIRVDETGTAFIANPIYEDALPRALAGGIAMFMPAPEIAWLDASGRLDRIHLLDSFLQFWRSYGHPLMGAAPYHEVAAQLVLLAWLHRVSNGGGSVSPEFRVLSGRIDLCLRHGDVTLGIELKVWRDARKDPLRDGLIQLDRYLTRLSGSGPRVPGWLVVFDQRTGLPEIAERTSASSVISPAGFEIVVIRA